MKRLRNAAFTLVEAVVFVAIASMLVILAWNFLFSGVKIGRTAAEGLSLHQGLRNLVENLTRDVNAAYLIAEPNAGNPNPHSGLVVYLFQDTSLGDIADGKVPRLELDDNKGGVYPFAESTGATQQALPVYQVRYEYEVEKRIVRRRVLTGNLLLKSADDPRAHGRITGYEFVAAEPANKRRQIRINQIMAREVEVFELYGFGFGDIYPDTAIRQIVPASEVSSDQVTLVALRLRAAYQREGEVKKAEDSSQEILTQIYSYPKLYDYLYRPYFSSVDGDMRY